MMVCVVDVNFFKFNLHYSKRWSRNYFVDLTGLFPLLSQVYCWAVMNVLYIRHSIWPISGKTWCSCELSFKIAFISVWCFPIRGTQRLSVCKISVRRSKYYLQFSITWGRLKISLWPFHSCRIFDDFPINPLLCLLSKV